MRTLKLLGVFVAAGLMGLSGCSSGSRGASNVTLTDSADTYHSPRTAVGSENSDRSRGYARTAAGTERPMGDRSAQGSAQNGQYVLAYPTGRRDTSVILLEADGPTQVRVGQPFTYNLRVTNLTDTPLHDVSVYDMGTNEGAPADAAATARQEAAGRTPPAPESDRQTGRMQSPTWDVGTLQPHQTLSHAVNGVADEVGTLRSCMAVTYTPTLCTMIQAVKPELQLTKEGPSSVLICQDIVYRYVVTNTGTGTANGVRIQETLPEGLTTADGGRSVNFDVGDLPAGATKEQRVTLRAQSRGEFTSRATASSGDARSQSRSITTAVREPVLAVAVDAPESRYVDEPVDYRVTVRNTGDAPAEHTVLRLATPGAAGDRNADRDLGAIPPGETRTIPVSMRAVATSNTGGEMRLQATAEAQCARPASGAAAVAVRTVPALLLECVDSIDPVRVGAKTVYTITVVNQGSGPDTNVGIRVTVPPEEQYVDGSGASKINANGQQLTFDPIPTLAPKQSVQWTVQVKGVRAGDARFNVDLTSNSLTRPASKSESTRVIDESGAPVNNNR